ncbi:hypothetical protein [Bifidobacterium jacchi]|uniref:DUF5648 domain-containing protein n=1 Tax=Bifidobacterium jacchi TaxID=2490545 RepID=A0A5N5RE51_9BIFI|nr:hypothetical protein [Bifidobacterium jacchi]KAB5605529.1 hypothetical protein EHS19_08960 [Bifidobacterium jacchi]
MNGTMLKAVRKVAGLCLAAAAAVTLTAMPAITPQEAQASAAPCFGGPSFKDLVAMYRLYNRNSGEHFYTSNKAERDMLRKAGWKYEGIGWNAPSKSTPKGYAIIEPVYRLYNRNAGDHHYTMNSAERDMLVAKGWKYEGIGWYSSNRSCMWPLYRQYNRRARRGSHNYTLNKAENDMLVAKGWKYEGIAWYGLYPQPSVE